MPRLSIYAAPAWVGALGPKLREAAKKGLLSAAHRLHQEVIRVVEERDPQPVDRGIYRAGWRVRELREGASLTNDVPYAPIVEHGARAENVKIGRAMIDALAEWVIRKGLVARGRGKAGREQAAAEARSIAWAIARKMQVQGIFNRDGQSGLKILEEALKLAPRVIADEVKAEVIRAMRGA